MTGALGGAQDKRSAEPERDVDALFPCFATMRSALARMDEVVDMLKVLWESPPVPTISHCIASVSWPVHCNPSKTSEK